MPTVPQGRRTLVVQKPRRRTKVGLEPTTSQHLYVLKHIFVTPLLSELEMALPLCQLLFLQKGGTNKIADTPFKNELSSLI